MRGRRGSHRSWRLRGKRVVTVVAATAAGVALVVAAGSSAAGGDKPGAALWSSVGDSLAPSQDGAQAVVRPKKLQAFTLDRGGLEGLLAAAPAQDTGRAQRSAAPQELVVSLPDPQGKFQRFALTQSDIMAPGLAEKHPEIQTYSGRGIDEPTATIHADLSPLGFHASVRRTAGAWYIDPYYHLDQSVYASYFGRDVPAEHESFVERDADGRGALRRQGLLPRGRHRHAHGSGFAANAAITITISDPEEQLRVAHASAPAPTSRARSRELRRRPGRQPRHAHRRGERRRASASASYQVVRDDDPTSDPPTGDVLRTLPTRPDHRPGLRRLPRRPGQRDRGEGHADEPRQPGLRGRPLDQAAADRATTTS